MPGAATAGFFTVERVLVVLASCAAIMGILLKEHCRNNGWSTPDQFYATCYSDLPQLFKDRGLAAGLFPVFSSGAHFDYPVGAALIAGFTALLVPGSGAGADRVLDYFDVNATLLAALWMVTVIATSRLNARRPWDGAMVALAPGIILAGFINWDLWAAALLALAMLFFARGRSTGAGILIGLATAVKLYPAFLLGLLFLLALRTRRFRPFLLSTTAAVATWLLVNLPLALGSPDAWTYFFTASTERGAGYSSPWYAYNLVAERLGSQALSAMGVTVLSSVGAVTVFAGVAALALAAPRRPRLAQLMFLLVAGFVLVNKEYSPQYIVWLVPLFALARPRWSAFLMWQAAEALHWAAVWLFLGQQTSGGNVQHNIDMPYYVLAVIVHMAALLGIMGLVIIDILRPESDVVRERGVDDPSGGPFNHAPDRFVLARTPAREAVGR